MFTKKIIFGLVLILGLLFWQNSTVKAVAKLPKITMLCEQKAGLLMAVNDGFSYFNSCLGKGRQVEIWGTQGLKGDQGIQGVTGPVGPTGAQGVQGLTGATGPQGSGSGTNSAGNVNFISSAGSQGPKIMTNDGIIWGYSSDGGWSNLNMNSPVAVNQIAQWDDSLLLDKNGDLWWYKEGGDGWSWSNISHP